ncbi:MAG: nucleotidyltransferase domain-containing protein, partial [Thermodesulfobacteriota bacterium]|nr:nucleotidyltransferase domain-containing protein [Thermodesulfobacteriota bacterium]
MSFNKRNTKQRPLWALNQNIFRKYPDIKAVYLFGSVGSGKTHRESDLDLAIVPRSGNL